MQKIFIFLSFQLILSVHAFADDINIIPLPVKVVRTTGNFILPKNSSIELNSPLSEVKEMALEFSKEIAATTGYCDDSDTINGEAVHQKC